MSKLPSIPEIPLEIDESVREILEPMKSIIDQLSAAVDPSKLPQTKPSSSGVIWSDKGELKIS